MCGSQNRLNFLVLFVLIFFDVVRSDHYKNLTERNSRKFHPRPQKKPLGTVESPLEGEELDSRLPKLFSFQALDEDMLVDLEFSVPFIHVPVKKSMQKTNQAFKSLVNLNTPAILLSGIIVFVGAGFGLIFNSLVGKSTGIRRKSRLTDASSLLDPFKFKYKNSDGVKSETAFYDLVQTIEEKFNQHNIDITACIQKSMCLYVRKSTEKVRNGNATGTNKIIDGLASSDWLLQYLEGSAVKDAIETGMSDTNCGHKYPTCIWSSPEKHIMDLAFGMLKLPTH